MGMKIRVEGDANSLLLPGDVKNLNIGGAAHADFGNMNRIPTCLIEDECSRARAALIEK